MTNKQTIGTQGENLATEHLQQAGYTIVARNWLCRAGELDIIAQKDGQLVFVEVKTRRNTPNDEIASSLTPQKRKKILLAIYTYLNGHKQDDEGWRFDFITVNIQPKQPALVAHMENALDW